MKSFFTWFAAVIVGGGIGFTLSHFIDFNMYLAIGAGIIIGSSIGITLNIYREPEDEIPEPDELPSSENLESEEPAEITQKAS
ncbi:MAG: hypothetical protein WD357_05850 [Gracilimonas sp.]